MIPPTPISSNTKLELSEVCSINMWKIIEGQTSELFTVSN